VTWGKLYSSRFYGFPSRACGRFKILILEILLRGIDRQEEENN